MSVTVQYATHADAVVIAELSRKTFYETFAHQNTKEDMDKFMAGQFSVDALVSEVISNVYLFFIAYVDEQPAGYLKLDEKNSPEEAGRRPAIEICRIYADSSFLGKGVGKALMEKALQVAMEKGKELIWLGVWEQNQRAIDFYTRWGFEKFGTHIFQLGDDPQTDWLMKKEMQP
jgi:ribosomal protein S18 acetylase RimI-like enzyme